MVTFGSEQFRGAFRFRGELLFGFLVGAFFGIQILAQGLDFSTGTLRKEFSSAFARCLTI